MEIKHRETTTPHEHARRVLTNVLVAPPIEEALFRALPLLIATLLTGHSVAVMVGANAIWAYLHVRCGDNRQILPHFGKGLLAVYLWLHGLGVLAVAVHATNNLIAELVAITTTECPRFDPTVFSPGEEH